MPWIELPDSVRLWTESWLGEQVVEARIAMGGFSPGFAGTITGISGREVFVKATGMSLNPDSPEIYRQEAGLVSRMPRAAPVPRLLASRDGDDGWVVLIFEHVSGHNPHLPWLADQLDRVLAAVCRLHAALTPSPVAAPSAQDALRDDIHGWGLLEADRTPALDPWAAGHIDDLVALEKRAPEAAAGKTLLHFDLRADNIVLGPESVYFVDWPHARIGAAWVDLVGMAPSVAMQGGPNPEDLLVRSALARDASQADVNAVVAAVAGYFAHRASLPAPPGLPTLRPFQKAQGDVALRWLRNRLESG